MTQGCNSTDQNQLVKSEDEALKAKDHAIIDQVLQEERSKLQREFQKKWCDKEKELKKEYADRDKQRQFKAENTIRSLISHAVKSMAETELTIDHIASTHMFQAVQQLGGRQVDTLLAQADSLSETLDRMRIKLTSSSSTDIVEANVVIDSLIP